MILCLLKDKLGERKAMSKTTEILAELSYSLFQELDAELLMPNDRNERTMSGSISSMRTTTHVWNNAATIE